MASDLFFSDSTVAVVVARPAIDNGPAGDVMRIAIDVALDQVSRSVPPRRCLYLVRPDRGLLVLATGESRRSSLDVEGIPTDLEQQMRKALEEAQVFVGIGAPPASLQDAAVSYRQAQKAVRVAQIVPSFGAVVAWSQLGIYRMLSRFPVEQLTSDVLHPGLVKLFERRDAESLLITLECYLDRGCDAKVTTAELGIHRATLYYRLQRIEEIVGVYIRDGEARLALHLGLKLARLAGIHPVPLPQ